MVQELVLSYPGNNKQTPCKRRKSNASGPNFNIRNQLLTQKILKQGYQYHKLFTEFYCRYYDLISKLNVRLKFLLRQELSEPEIYGDLVYKLSKIVGTNTFTAVN